MDASTANSADAEQPPPKPLAPPYQKIQDDLLARIDFSNESLGESAEFFVASPHELQVLLNSTAFYQWPLLLFDSEASRIQIWNIQTSRMLAKIVDITQTERIEEEVKKVPFVVKDIVTKYTGRLRMSTCCSICRGVFSEKGCKKASVIQHPSCRCGGIPIYGRYCIIRAFEICDNCPACAGNLRNNPEVTRQILTVVRTRVLDIITYRQKEQREQRIRRDDLLQRIQDIREVTEPHILKERANVELTEGLYERAIEASIATSFNSEKYFAILVKILSYKRAIDAWHDEEYQVRGDLELARELMRMACKEALASIEKTEKSAEATALIASISMAPEPELLLYSQFPMNREQLALYEATDPQGLLYWSPDTTSSSGYCSNLDYVHVKVLSELEYHAGSHIFNSNFQWMPQEAILAGLTFACGVDFLLESLKLSASAIKALQFRSEQVIRRVALLSYHTGVSVVIPSKRILFAGFKDMYHGVKLGLIIDVGRKKHDPETAAGAHVRRIVSKLLGNESDAEWAAFLEAFEG